MTAATTGALAPGAGAAALMALMALIPPSTLAAVPETASRLVGGVIWSRPEVP